MKVAKIRPKGNPSWGVMEINELNFGKLKSELEAIEVGRKIFKRWNPTLDYSEWGNFGDEFDGADTDTVMVIEIIEMSEKEIASLPEFEGWR